MANSNSSRLYRENKKINGLIVQDIRMSTLETHIPVARDHFNHILLKPEIGRYDREFMEDNNEEKIKVSSESIQEEKV